MSRLAIKICGLSTPQAIDAALRAQASHVGLVFFPKSPRNVDVGSAPGLVSAVPDHVERVGVMVDPDDELLARAIAAAGLSAIQLHGAETPARAAAIRQRFGIPVWKAISVKVRADLLAASAYTDAADRLLFDAKTPDGAALPGGMGLRFDWSLLRDVRPALPWGLSGGLDAENVGRAVRMTGAALVDVSSGVESAPGVKDVDKIAAFCEAARLS